MSCSPAIEIGRVLPALTGTAYLRTPGEQRTTAHFFDSSICASTILPLSSAGQASRNSNTASATIGSARPTRGRRCRLARCTDHAAVAAPESCAVSRYETTSRLPNTTPGVAARRAHHLHRHVGGQEDLAAEMVERQPVANDHAVRVGLVGLDLESGDDARRIQRAVEHAPHAEVMALLGAEVAAASRWPLK